MCDSARVVTPGGQSYVPNHTAPHFGTGFFSWYLHLVGAGPYRVEMRFSDIGGLRAYTFVLDPISGQPVVDPTWAGAEYLPNRLLLKDLTFPDDFLTHCELAFDCPETNETGIGGARVWVGPTELIAGGPGAYPPGFEQHYRGLVRAGSHWLRVDHPAHLLPPESARLELASTLLQRRIALRPAPLPVPQLVILPADAYVTAGIRVRLETNLPASHASAVRWRSSDDQILRPTQAPGEFEATGPGYATITAAYRQLTASVEIAVRADATSDVVRPTPPDAFAFDTWAEGEVARGEVLVQLKEGVAPVQEEALFRELGLVRAGVVADQRAHQLMFSPQQWTLKALVERLRADARVAQAIPHYRFQVSAIKPDPPSEVKKAPVSDFWHLYKIEAFAAFGLLQKLPRTTQSIVFVDTGLWLSNAFEPHADFKSRIDLSRTRAPGVVKDSVGLLAVRSDDPHGTAVVGAAVAAWDGAAAAGIDPLARVVMLKTKREVFSMQAALNYAAKCMDAKTTRVVSFTYGGNDPASNTPNWWARLWGNEWLDDNFSAVMAKSGLVVIAAGNNNRSVDVEPVISVKRELDAAEHNSVLVIGGTSASAKDPEGPEGRSVTPPTGSNYDVPGATQHIDLAAPGFRVRVSTPGNLAGPQSGTSFSSPLVAGAAAALFSILPEGTPAATVKQILVETADPFTEIDPASPPNPLPKLYRHRGQGLGAGRLNLWQAVLDAANRSATAVERYVGLRVTADKTGLHLFVQEGSAAELPIGEIPKNRVEGTEAVRASFAVPAGGLELTVIARTAGSPTAPEACRLTIPFDAARVGSLSPRFVQTLIVYTQGKARFQPQPRRERELPPNIAMMTIDNEGIGPEDPELLDPAKWRPWDKSWRPWMRLERGDSFAIETVVLEGPAGLRVRLLDENLLPLSPAQVDDLDRPYVTVPFQSSGRFAVRADFPPGATAAEAKILVRFTSLNNELVRDETTVTLRPGPPPLFTFRPLPEQPVTAPGWEGSHRVIVSYNGPHLPPGSPLQVRMRADVHPAEWKKYVRFDPSYQYAGQGNDLFVSVWSPKTLDTGEAVCRVRLESDLEPGVVYHEALGFRYEHTDLVVKAEVISSESVQVSEGAPYPYLYADYPIVILNRSRFKVRIARHVFAQQEHLTGTFVDARADLLGGEWPDHAFSRVLEVDESASLTLRLMYAPVSLAEGGARVGIRTFRMFCWDPYYPPAESVDGEWANEVTFRTPLRLAGPATQPA